eukprot:TRINITY_DN20660_c0_g1_i1.p1 TRINITY_DN20660_c0_g1~~TRINITY_DN20660_c0_g1_i1.p1  ORF type:complete len:204 (-),score=3.93 TRINITY_DN20660_c0_g1_i1:2581-3192(-)
MLATQTNLLKSSASHGSCALPLQLEKYSVHSLLPKSIVFLYCFPKEISQVPLYHYQQAFLGASTMSRNVCQIPAEAFPVCHARGDCVAMICLHLSCVFLPKTGHLSFTSEVQLPHETTKPVINDSRLEDLALLTFQDLPLYSLVSPSICSYAAQPAAAFKRPTWATYSNAMVSLFCNSADSSSSCVLQRLLRWCSLYSCTVLH